MREMLIDSIRVSLMNYQRVVILKVKDADRYLPIWIGASEADAIAVKLQDVAISRPLTHDLLGSIINSLGAKVNGIVVSGLDQDTFYAKVILAIDGDTMEVDSRPSDAIALAVRASAPIFADESVLDKAGVDMDAETGKPKQLSGASPQAPLREEELKSLSAFTEFVSTLDLDDLGESKSDEGDSGDQPGES
ncbi:MAG: hypothetical protein CL880_00240 [Dehalococcoidia bacterium]|nr:hypothetical protein [Dehalococcoidia bacterium]